MIMLPPVFWRCKIGATSLINRKVALTLTSNILSHASSGQSNTEPTTGLTAAFEIRISILLKLSKAALYSACRSSATETWHLTPITLFKPFCLSESNALFTLSCFRLLITTFAPSCSNRSAVARPILIFNWTISVNITETCLIESDKRIYPSVDAVTSATLLARRWAIDTELVELFRCNPNAFGKRFCRSAWRPRTTRNELLFTIDILTPFAYFVWINKY